MQYLTRAQVQRQWERIEVLKRQLGCASYRLLGIVETRRTSGGSVLLRYRSPPALQQRPPAWERAVEIVVGALSLKMRAVQGEQGVLVYTRLGSRSPSEPDCGGAVFVAQPGLELTLIAADTPIRAATTSRRGQAIFHLTRGAFSLLLALQAGWELKIVWY